MKQLETNLGDRILRFDGVSVVAPEMIARCLLLGTPPSLLRVNGSNWEIEQFNINVPAEEQLKVACAEPVSLNLRWKLPPEYLNLDIAERVAADLAGKIDTLKYDAAQELEALDRIEAELAKIEQRGMTEFFRTIIYVIDTFRKEGVVWGVGRGSSCASFILHILGLHSVDCIRFKIPLSEFFHD